MIEHKGYSGQYRFDQEAGIYHGELTGIRDVVTFQGRTEEEARKAFVESVEDYLEFIAELGP